MIEYSGAGGIQPLRGLAEASNTPLERVVELAQKGELNRLFAGGKRFLINRAPEPAPIDVAQLRAAKQSTSPHHALLALRRRAH